MFPAPSQAPSTARFLQLCVLGTLGLSRAAYGFFLTIMLSKQRK